MVRLTRVSGCLDAVMGTNRGNGRFVEPGDAESLARVILELYRHPEERRRLGNAARRTVSERFSSEAMLTRLDTTWSSGEWQSGMIRLAAAYEK